MAGSVREKTWLWLRNGVIGAFVLLGFSLRFHAKELEAVGFREIRQLLSNILQALFLRVEGWKEHEMH